MSLKLMIDSDSMIMFTYIVACRKCMTLNRSFIRENVNTRRNGVIIQNWSVERALGLESNFNATLARIIYVNLCAVDKRLSVREGDARYLLKARDAATCEV